MSSSEDNQVELFLKGRYSKVNGFWPLVDENYDETPFVAVGSKSGLPEIFDALKHKYKKLTFIYNCQNGPHLHSNYRYIGNNFDGIFDLDYVDRDLRKSLFCNHSMMVRSMPYKGFFWENADVEKIYDFSILTWGPSDKIAKRWDRAEKVCDYLCKRGLKGIVFSQRDKEKDFLNEVITPHVETGKLYIYDQDYHYIDFHKLMCRAKYSIFPNAQDAFPKFIIESLLANRPIVFASDLLLGRKILDDLGGSICCKVDFEDESHLEIIYQFISKNAGDKSPREEWYKRYHFNLLAESWADEFNRLFGTKHKKLFFMNHIPRLKEHNLI